MEKKIPLLRAFLLTLETALGMAHLHGQIDA